MAEARLTPLELDETTHWTRPRPTPPPDAPRIRVLPGFDEFVLGYRDRGIIMDAATARRIVPGGNGLFRPTIVLDGRVVGTWGLGSATRRSSVTELFRPLDDAASSALARALRECDAFAGDS
jgi:hypothetical protein